MWCSRFFWSSSFLIDFEIAAMASMHRERQTESCWRALVMTSKNYYELTWKPSASTWRLQSSKGKGAQGSRVVDVGVGKGPEADVEGRRETAPGGISTCQKFDVCHQLLPGQPILRGRWLCHCLSCRTRHKHFSSQQHQLTARP